MTRPVKQIESITEDLRKVSQKIGLLAGDKLVSHRQSAAVESLQRSLDGVRGFELGMARQAFGLDDNLVDLTERIKTGRSRRKESSS